MTEGVRTFRLGEHLLLDGGEATKLHLLRPSVRARWEELAMGLAPEAAARLLDEEFGSTSPTGDAQRSRVRALPDLAGSALPAGPQRTHSDRSRQRVYALCGRPVAVRFEPPELESLVHPRFAHSEQEDVEPVAALTLARTDAGYAILEQGRVPIVERTETAILGELVRRFVEINNPLSAWIAVLHAAVVADTSGRGIILPGANGRGKSTLVAGLLSKGYRYLSDDCAPIDRDERVVPVPYGLCLKEASWDVVAQHLPSLWTAPIYHLDGRSCRYVAPPPDDPPPMRVEMIIFPKYRRATPRCLRRLDPVETLILLSESRMWLSRTPSDLRAAVDLIERVPAFELAYSDLETAVDAVRTLSDGLR